VEAGYGIDAPDLTYAVENMNTYSHANSAVDPLAEPGGMPGRAFRPVLAAPLLTGGCVEIHSLGGGVIGWKPALNEGGIAGAVESWKNEIDDAHDAGLAPDALAHLADQVWKRVFSNQYGTTVPPQYEGSVYRKAPPIWVHLDFKVCPSGAISPLSGESTVARSSFMPDLYLWVNNGPVDGIGASNPSGAPVLTGDFSAFTRGVNHSYPAFEECDFSVSSEFEKRHGNPWNIGAIFDGKDTGDSAEFCNGVFVPEH